MASMTDSQFKTFRADINRTCAAVTREIMQNELDRVHINAQRAATVEVQNQLRGLHQEIDGVNGSLATLTTTVANLTFQRDQLEAELAAEREASRVTVTINNARLQREVEDSTARPTGAPEQWNRKPKPKDGDKLMNNGEVFYWWFGQWRRPSELEGFVSWITRRALNPNPFKI